MMNSEMLRTDAEELKGLDDDKIDFSDIPELDYDWAKNAKWEILEPSDTKITFKLAS